MYKITFSLVKKSKVSKNNRSNKSISNKNKNDKRRKNSKNSKNTPKITNIKEIKSPNNRKNNSKSPKKKEEKNSNRKKNEKIIEETKKETEVKENQMVKAGDPLTEGSIDPHDILSIQGVRAVEDYLLKEVCRSRISQKHGRVPLHVSFRAESRIHPSVGRRPSS